MGGFGALLLLICYVWLLWLIALVCVSLSFVGLVTCCFVCPVTSVCSGFGSW